MIFHGRGEKMAEAGIYHTAVYLRLSRDDGDVKGSNKPESNSISSQRELIFAFMKKHKDMELFDTYADDGYSGTDFERPAFKRMMKDVMEGSINCIIVKDLSRLGRDYIEAGRLIQKIFPAFSVRFIAVTDNFDSLTADFNEKSLVLPIKNFINDSYCRDISEKVRSSKRISCEQGKFVGAFAVYGYKKDAANRNRLVPDEYAAEIVKSVFDWKLEGMSNQAIADCLNERGILSPMEYKKIHGERFYTGFCTTPSGKWSSVAVRRILTNEIYTGTLVQSKTEKVNYKVNKVVKKPETEWIRVSGTHAAIVSKADYETVQSLMRTAVRAVHGERKPHLFSGLLFCGDCKSPMIRRRNRYNGKERVYFICAARNKGRGCTRHSVCAEDLEQVLPEVLKTYIPPLAQKALPEKYMEGIKTGTEEKQRYANELESLRQQQEKYARVRSEAYEDWKNGIIGEEDYRSFCDIFEKKYEMYREAAIRHQEMAEKAGSSIPGQNEGRECSKESTEDPALTRGALIFFIERIEIYEGKRIFVRFTWSPA